MNSRMTILKFFKALFYFGLFLLNIIPVVDPTLNFFFFALLIGALYARSRNRNVRSLLKVISGIMLLVYSVDTAINVTFITFGFRNEFWMDLVKHGSWILGLLVLRFGVFYRVEVDHCFRRLFAIRQPTFEVVVAETVIVRYFSMLAGVYSTITAFHLYFSYYFCRTLAQYSAPESSPYFHGYINTAEFLAHTANIGIALLYMLLLLVLHTKAQTIDHRRKNNNAFAN